MDKVLQRGAAGGVEGGIEKQDITIMQNTVAKDTLREYVMRNEVVFQAFGDLVKVANDL